MSSPGDNFTVASTWRQPLAEPAGIPDAADVVIIGGGIVGVCAAWFLARDGISVALCEKSHIACEQSGRNWGWVRKQGRDPRELEIMIDSMRIWETLADDIGEDVGFARGGCLFAAGSERDLAGFEAWREIAREHELDTELIDAAAMGRLVHGAAKGWTGALYTASDGRAEPQLATPAIARAAAREGAAVLTSCAVRGLDIEAGCVAGVVTEHGRIRAKTVVCATGAWSSLFCRSLGIELPQLTVKGTVARTAPGPDLLDGNLFDADFGIRRRIDGGYTIAPGRVLDHPVTPASFRYFFKFWRALKKDLRLVRLSFGRPFFYELAQPERWPLDRPSPFERRRVLDPPVNRRALSRLHRDIVRVFPALAGVRIVESWAGMIESTPDVVPVIDEVESLPGLYIATGFSGHGFGIGPGAGKVIARLVSGRSQEVDLAPLRLSRFSDGTPIRPQTII